MESLRSVTAGLVFFFDWIKGLPDGEGQQPSTWGPVLDLLDSLCLCAQLECLLPEF